VSGEESVGQVRLRAERTGAVVDGLYLASETDLANVLGQIDSINPNLLVVDSVQTIASPDVDGRAGGVSQVQEVSATLTRVAKATHTPIVIVAQVTKDGNIAGPKTLEHLVDTVLFFEGDRTTSLRLLRTIKNRFGAADEVACFEQQENGIIEVPDPSSLFRTGRDEPVAGTCITVTMEGRRALLAEVQALVATTNAPNPRRGVSGLDNARMAMLVAVTERHGRLRMFDKDTFLATVAGMKIIEPAADLAVCLALASAVWDAPMPQDVAAIGEVALSGDIRPVSNMTQRLNEAARLGFNRVLVPAGTKKPAGSNLVLIEVPHLGRALAALRQMAPARADKDTE
jgi:DNA repair protein RadA/Sms